MTFEEARDELLAMGFRQRRVSNDYALRLASFKFKYEDGYQIIVDLALQPNAYTGIQLIDKNYFTVKTVDFYNPYLQECTLEEGYDKVIEYIKEE